MAGRAAETWLTNQAMEMLDRLPRLKVPWHRVPRILTVALHLEGFRRVLFHPKLITAMQEDPKVPKVLTEAHR